jgi:predicted small secreted protein
MNKLYIALIAVCFSVAMSGCSTVEGIGKDLKKGGEAIQEASKK